MKQEFTFKVTVDVTEQQPPVNDRLPTDDPLFRRATFSCGGQCLECRVHQDLAGVILTVDNESMQMVQRLHFADMENLLHFITVMRDLDFKVAAHLGYIDPLDETSIEKI